MLTEPAGISLLLKELLREAGRGGRHSHANIPASGRSLGDPHPHPHALKRPGDRGRGGGKQRDTEPSSLPQTSRCQTGPGTSLESKKDSPRDSNLALRRSLDPKLRSHDSCPVQRRRKEGMGKQEAPYLPRACPLSWGR